jgi:hypothetical protein
VKCRTTYLNKGRFKDRRNRADPSVRHGERPQATATNIIRLVISVGSGHDTRAARRQTGQTQLQRNLGLNLFFRRLRLHLHVFSAPRISSKLQIILRNAGENSNF